MKKETSFDQKYRNIDIIKWTVHKHAKEMVDELFIDVASKSVPGSLITFMKTEIMKSFVKQEDDAMSSAFGTQSLLDSAAFLEDVLEKAQKHVGNTSHSD